MQGFKVKASALEFSETLRPWNLETWNLVDDQEEVRAGSYRVRRVWRFSLDHVVGRTGSNLQWERETAQRDAGDPGTAGFKNGGALLADADRGRAGEREAGLKS